MIKELLAHSSTSPLMRRPERVSNRRRLKEEEKGERARKEHWLPKHNSKDSNNNKQADSHHALLL